MTTLNKRAARAAGYRALTSRFRLPEEQGMLNGVLTDMRRGNISHVLVKDRLGVSVWRKGRSVATTGPVSRLQTCDTADCKSALRGRVAA
jgi:hypothetical protein